MEEEACCTCATRLSAVKRDGHGGAKMETPRLQDDRRLGCCSRVICGRCICTNPRFASYCPYCQTTDGPSALPQGLREPPPYTPPPACRARELSPPPPPYQLEDSMPSARALVSPPCKNAATAGEKALSGGSDGDEAAEDTLHFVGHNDTVASLALRYGVPPQELRRANRLASDHLLAARRTVVIPGAYYKGGVSLSPRPVEGEEEEVRKAKIRRWMVACKEADYDVAVMYLENADYDLDKAVETYVADEAWERRHPLVETRGGRGRQRCAEIGGIWNRASQAAFLRRAGPSASKRQL